MLDEQARLGRGASGAVFRWAALPRIGDRGPALAACMPQPFIRAGACGLLAGQHWGPEPRGPMCVVPRRVLPPCGSPQTAAEWHGGEQQSWHKCLPASGRALASGEHAARRPRRAGFRGCAPAPGVPLARARAGRCRAAHELGGEEYAVKVVALRKYEDRALVARERRALELLRGAPRVVQLRRAYLAARRAHLVFECAPGPGWADRCGARASAHWLPGHRHFLCASPCAMQTRAGMANVDYVQVSRPLSARAQWHGGVLRRGLWMPPAGAVAAFPAISWQAQRWSVATRLRLSAPSVRPILPGAEAPTAAHAPQAAGPGRHAARAAARGRRPAAARARARPRARAAHGARPGARASLCGRARR